MDTRPVKNFNVPEAQPYLWEGDDHGVLLIHGFTGSCGHMRLLGEHLRDAGFTVMGINLPGHATSMDDMGRYDWEDWLQAVRDARDELKKRCGKVSVCGLSMGGDLTLILAQEGGLTAAVPISAPMAVQNKAMAFAGPASLFIKRIMWQSNPERPSMLDKRYNLGYAGFPTKCAVSLSKLIHMARNGLARITCPVLAVQSHGDETISADSAQVIADGVQSSVKRVLWLEEVPHVCTISSEHQHIADEVIRHLREAEAL